VRTRDDRLLLGPIDLVVRAGERWAVLGRNGSGKTTLLSLAGGRRQPSSGVVTVLGGSFGRTDMRDLRRRVGHAGHRLAESMRPSMSALETVLTGRDSILESWTLAPSGADTDEALRRLAQAGCASLAGRTIGTLSQGERQRVLLARAAFGSPELLILDEPAAGLDLPSREAVVAAMDALGDTTLLVATHHLEELPSTTTHAALLRDGALVAAGPVDQVLCSDALSDCFAMAVDVARRNGRWSAAARPAGRNKGV